MERRLRITKGSLEGRSFVLGTRTVIGRSGDTDVQLLEKGVSRQHACLIEDDHGQIVLMDLSSRNGTWMGPNRVTQRFLQPGDEFVVGDSSFIYEQVEGGNPNDPYAESDEESDLKLLSGRALEATAVARLVDISRVGPPGCGDPMHAVAQAKGWKHCPACGGPLRAS